MTVAELLEYLNSVDKNTKVVFMDSYVGTQYEFVDVLEYPENNEIVINVEPV